MSKLILYTKQNNSIPIYTEAKVTRFRGMYVCMYVWSARLPSGEVSRGAEIVSEDDTAHQHLAKANHALAGYLAHAPTCLDEYKCTVDLTQSTGATRVWHRLRRC